MRPGRSPRTARGSKPRLRPGFSALIERLPSRGQTVRFPRLSRYSRGLLRSPRPSSGLRSLARDPLAAAGSLTPSSERLKAPAAPGLFRGDGEITVKGSKCQGWGISSAIKGVGVRKQAQISPPPFFFAAVACRRQRLEAIPPSGSKIHRAAGGSAVRAAAATAKPTAAAGVQLVGLQQRGQQNGRR